MPLLSRLNKKVVVHLAFSVDNEFRLQSSIANVRFFRLQSVLLKHGRLFGRVRIPH